MCELLWRWILFLVYWIFGMRGEMNGERGIVPSLPETNFGMLLCD
jgi:hypothetical protein